MWNHISPILSRLYATKTTARENHQHLNDTIMTLLRLLLMAPAVASAMPTGPSAIFARDDDSTKTCSVGKGLNQCGSSLPDDMCCQDGTQCITLAGATTLLCCPDGSSCDRLKPITCNVQLQNATQHPDVALKTTVFDVNLEKCGSGCCPFGFSCKDGGDECTMDDDQSVKPGKKNKDKDPSASSTASASATATATSSSTEDPYAVPSQTVTESPSSTGTQSLDGASTSSDSDSGNSGGKPDTTTIIGGILGAAAALLIISVLVWVCVRKRAQRRAAYATANGTRKKPDMVIHGRNISEPITKPDIYRSEFMLRRGDPDSAASQQQQQQQQQGPPIRGSVRRLSVFPSSSRFHRASIPNRFASDASPNPSVAESFASFTGGNGDDDDVSTVRTGQVGGARLPPIRSMKSSAHHPSTATAIRAAAAKNSAHLKPEFASIPRRSVRPTTHDAGENVFDDPFSAREDDEVAYTPYRAPPAPGANSAGGLLPVRSGTNRSVTRETRFSSLMRQADLADVQNGKPFVPTGKTPRL